MEEIKPVYIKGTIIIVAVYINNDLNNYNHLISCLTQLRKIYINETIITVDNCSLNNSWYAVANKYNMNILYNNSDIHRFEVGAYKMALQHFRSDKYIFIQGTIFINNKLNLSQLDTSEETALFFDFIINNLSWTNEGLKLINNMLKTINMNDWNNDPLVLWNCFCCNNIFISNMLTSGVFDLPSNSKAHSCAFERVLGCYFKKVMKDIKCIDKNSFYKIWLSQDPLLI